MSVFYDTCFAVSESMNEDKLKIQTSHLRRSHCCNILLRNRMIDMGNSKDEM